MSDLISKLGIDWRLLTAQIVNFTLLFLVLRKFAYKPILSMLQKRSNIIARSIDEAKKIEEDAKKMEQAKEAEIRQSRIKARDIVNHAVGLAEGQKAKILEKAKTDGNKLIEEAKDIVRMQKEQMLKEAEKETGALAISMVEKFFKSGITKSEQEKIVKNIVSSI